MSAKRTGDLIYHPDWGEGKLMKLLPSGRALVRLDRTPGLPRTLPLEELSLREPEPELVPVHASAMGAEASAGAGAGAARKPAPVARAPIVPRLLPSAEQEVLPKEHDLDPTRLASLRQAIEALRLGVVPNEHSREYTVARKTQLAQVHDLLEQDGGLRIVWGDYGTGKTHLLDIAEQMGQRAGYMTARIILDPSEIPPTHPKRLYTALVEHLHYPDGLTGGLEPMLHRLADSDAHALPGGARFSRFFSPFLFALRKGNADLMDWMRDYVDGCFMDVSEGNSRLHRLDWTGENLLTLSDYRTYGRMYIHMLGNLAAWAKDAGFRGLMLLFDEVEFVDSLSKEGLHYAMEVLRHFAAVTVPPEQLAFEPDKMYRGGHQVHRDLELKFSDDQGLAVVFALTPLEDIRQRFAELIATDALDIPLSPLSTADCEQLVSNVATLYSRAYPGFEPSERSLGILGGALHRSLDEGNDSPRSIVRGCVFHLDCERIRGLPASLDGEV